MNIIGLTDKKKKKINSYK